MSTRQMENGYDCDDYQLLAEFSGGLSSQSVIV